MPPPPPRLFSRLALLCSVLALLGCAAVDLAHASTTFSVVWGDHPPANGNVTVSRGTLNRIAVSGASAGATTNGVFELAPNRPARLELEVTADPARTDLPTLVTIHVAPRAFTFRLQDVDAEYPIYLPADRAAITTSSDSRSFNEIAQAIRSRVGQTKMQRFARAPEASFAEAAATSRVQKIQTWLGLGRDIRLFRVTETLESFQPRFAGYETPLPETPKQPATYGFQFGRGWGPRENKTRTLDEQVLPILHSTIDDDDVRYDITLFASLERSPLTAAHVRGTDFLVADAYGHGHMFTPEQAALEKSRHESEMSQPEEVVLYVRAIATNRGKAPQFAFLRTATPSLATPISPQLPAWTYDRQRGFGIFASGRIFACSKLDGVAAPAEENSILLKPGAHAVFEFFVPHRPVSAERATALAQQSFEARLAEARTYWRTKLKAAAQWQVPEPRIAQMAQAGLLHLDLVLYGREPDAPLLPAIGVYTAIGSESAPIIQYLDSMGLHDQAARALDFFLEKQHADGFIQNFNGYMLETGAVLWTIGEHFRYTHDETWLRRVHPKVTKSWQYLRDWRRRNLQPELKGRGYGLLDGKTADPEDPYRSFMLNGYAYLGLARTAEALQFIAPAEAAECLTEANALKADLRAAFTEALEASPVVPLGDGTWSRAAPPWTDYRGPVMLHADGGSWFTHGSMAGRDSLLGPLYLAFQEVLTPDEPMTGELLNVHSELMTDGNVAFSQPYYSRHPWIHLQRGETNAFLQAWYGAVAALPDRETYTFAEHFFPVSNHKTHEEAWFLMETRWMLYLESGDTLRLLSGMPRAYLQPGAQVGVSKAGSAFGPLTFEVQVSNDGRTIHVKVDASSARHPRTVTVRVPHPSTRRAVSIEGGGRYLAEQETVQIDDFTGHGEVTLRFP